ncbi:ASPIC/UnbV protein [Pontibacter ummariensis]|uniref:ASPIC and UnbV n=1 Tax=Pontibacter ummariensis TaxID=1610492 RepID=A0A239B8I0_9BACT|nr:CRTAC1 family protein [Pontibacter ummariensis]PRY16355.1 ASPIC/UnbV protein [Pontibacter ummariensis]SNS03678.1 ASPIC and UnbV [Pontibacter ummariensis]
MTRQLRRYFKQTSYAFLSAALLLSSCGEKEPDNGNEAMATLLEEVAQRFYIPDNRFANHARVTHFDELAGKATGRKKFDYEYQKAVELLRAGKPAEAAELFEKLYQELPQIAYSFTPKDADLADKLEGDIAQAYLRLGEQENCLINHTSASCIFPIASAGFHQLPTGSRKAIEHYTSLLSRNPDALQYRWLLNIAYMTLGEYPQSVPEKWLIPLENELAHPVARFEEIAGELGVDVDDISGGSILEDFDNDGYLDIMASSYGLRDQIRFFHSNGDGTFTDQTEGARLKGITNSLNMMQADYNNDGYVDVLVLRGAWFENQGKQPNSLLRNNGNGTFTDVTAEAGLLSFYPTQTATWADFNNDGWLDLFIGNETADKFSPNPCELYLNHRGVFKNIAKEAGVELVQYVKGVTSGDYDNDGWQDIYVSTLYGQNYLFRNLGLGKKEQLRFEDVTQKAGLHKPMLSFPTWFYDYDNDGWLDIFVSGFKFSSDPSVSYNVAAEYLGLPSDAEKARLYRNNRNGTFTDVSKAVGISKGLYTMGSNFMDIDNDGWLDMYLGTGDPSFESIIPNKLFRNNEGKNFQDVTTAAGVGHLQKGHAVSAGDLDNDGDQDIYTVMGGAFEGDNYRNALFKNTYQESSPAANNWIKIKLEGTKANKAAIGTRLKITFTDGGKPRTIYRDINSGGSFGASTLRAELGLGQATKIDKLEVKWAGSNRTQVFDNIGANQFIQITEGHDQVNKLDIKKLNLKKKKGGHDLHRAHLSNHS